MIGLHEAAQQAIALIASARLCEVNSMSSRREMLRLLIEATDTLRDALAEPVQEPVACLIGIKNRAFDLPTTKRAYTYAEQPDNVVASRLGSSCNAAALQSAGDTIDRGLALLQELQKQGFGVFDLGAEYTAPPQREPLTEEEIDQEYKKGYADGYAAGYDNGDSEGFTRGTDSMVPSSLAAWRAQTLPLTEAQIYAAIKGIDSLKAVEVARAIERAHKIE